MKKIIKYSKIGQFREVVGAINRIVHYVGNDENGDPIYDSSIKKPVLTFTGTVKAHGTNGGVCFNDQSGLWPQSRRDILLEEDENGKIKDNTGFGFFIKSNEDSFIEICKQVAKDNDIDTSIYTISVYGEWAGKGIQKGVALNEIDKSFFIFAAKISKTGDDEFNSYYVDIDNYRNIEKRIFNIRDYGVYSIDIDFNMPQLVQNKLSDMTIAVEEECPIGKAFGISGVGEGIVWQCTYKGSTHKFKVKGEKYSVSKVKTLAPVDVEKLNSIKEFVEYAVTENRFKQAMQETFGDDEVDIKQLGKLLSWMVKDVMSEEMDTMVKNNLEPKDVNQYISGKAREMFFEEYNKF